MIEIAVLGALCVVALGGALWPLLRPGEAVDRAGLARAVYRDQLAELDRDLLRGVVAPEEAEATRAEIGRRLLAVPASAPNGVRRANPVLAGVIGLFIAAEAGWIYMKLGAPGVPDMPFAARPEASAPVDDAAEIKAAIAALSAAVQRDPGNVMRLLVLARAQGGTGDWAAAAETYRRALALDPNRAEAQLGLGAALTVGNNSIVTEPAKAAFARAVAMAPGNSVARFYLALADAQAGNTEAAMAAWTKIAGELDEDNPVRGEIARRLEASGRKVPPPAPPPPPPQAAAAPGPDAGAMAGVAQMTPEAQKAFIASMIARLAARMEANPGDAEGWLRLARAYRGAGDEAKADQALAMAAKARPDDPEVLLAQARALVDGIAPEAPLPGAAVALFSRLEAVDPANPDALWYLGLAAAQAKRLEEARGFWVRLLPLLGPETPERRMVSEALASVSGKPGQP